MSQWKTNVKIPGVPDEHQQFAREEQLKHRRASERLDRDCRIACQPQVDVPFSSAMDALERLLPFHVFYNDTEDELALLEENPKSDAKKKALNTKPVINDWQEQEEVIREREEWREKQEERGEDMTKRLLENLEKVESACKRLYATDDLRSEEKLFIASLMREEEAAQAPPKKAKRSMKKSGDGEAKKEAILKEDPDFEAEEDADDE